MINIHENNNNEQNENAEREQFFYIVIPLSTMSKHTERNKPFDNQHSFPVLKYTQLL